MPQDTAGEVQLILDGALTMRTVDATRAKLLAAIEPLSDAEPNRIGGPGIAIDCSAASEIDLTFIQLLIAARASTQAAGRTISLSRCPDGVLLDALTRGGFRLVPESDEGFWFTGEAA